MPPERPHGLSVVLITLNAASQLDACLASAAFADELLVVDSGSDDGTAELAARLGARRHGLAKLAGRAEDDDFHERAA